MGPTWVTPGHCVTSSAIECVMHPCFHFVTSLGGWLWRGHPSCSGRGPRGEGLSLPPTAALGCHLGDGPSRSRPARGQNHGAPEFLAPGDHEILLVDVLSHCVLSSSPRSPPRAPIGVVLHMWCVGDSWGIGHTCVSLCLRDGLAGQGQSVICTFN